MTRRRDHDVTKTYFMIQVVCRTDESHHVGKVVRQRGRDMLETGLERIDGPNGETKVQAVCGLCRAGGSKATPQIRWDRVAAMLDEMEATGEHYRTLAL